MNDRLNDLRKGAAPADSVALRVTDKDSLLRDNGNGAPSTNESKFMKDFFGDVEIVKQSIMAIKEASSQMADIDQAVVLATTPEKERELSGHMTPIITETNKRAAFTKQLLQRLREETERMKTASGARDQNELRIRENLINTLTRKFVDVMKEYQNAQQKFKMDIKKKMKRQVQIVHPDATPAEVEEVISSGGVSGEIIKNVILKGSPSDLVRNATQNVADKYQDVLRLEASVAELHQMFLDFAVLTEQQGELLDQIEFQVKSASDFVDDGNKEMVQAIDYQISIRKKQLCIFMIVIVVIGVIALIIAFATGSLEK